MIPWQVISWGLTQVGLVNGAPREANLSGGQFVLLGNVEVSTAQALIFGPGCIACADPRQENAKRVLQLVSARTHWVDRVYSKDMFRLEFGRTFNSERELTDMDIEVLLKYLTRDKGEIAYDGEVILNNLLDLTSC